jgi:hypothetical protein
MRNVILGIFLEGYVVVVVVRKVIVKCSDFYCLHLSLAYILLDPCG